MNGGNIYSSSNSGSTWSQTSAPSAVWSAIKCNSSGSIITASINNGTIWLSTNSGSTWTNSYNPVSRWNAGSWNAASWNALCLDANGIYLNITTTNPLYAFTFTISNGLLTTTSKYISNICSNPTGQYLGLTTYGGSVYNSMNYGASWSTNSNFSTGNWQAICSYSNGSKYIACIKDGNITFSSSSTWKQRAIFEGWQGITSSSDGRKLAACIYPGYIYTSTDSADTWTPQTSSGSRTWQDITSSSDGTKLAAIVYNGNIWTSTDSGVTWTQRAIIGKWLTITSSSDGTKLAAGLDAQSIYTSTDSGVTWTPRTSPSTYKIWSGLASSNDGVKLATTSNGEYIYTSTDSGVSWTQRASVDQWQYIASSSDGTKLAAICDAGYIYTSANSGVTWTQVASYQNWTSITSSSDGTRLAASVRFGNIWNSTDSGVTWTQQSAVGSQSWTCISSSSDGINIVAGKSSGYIWTISLTTSTSPSIANWQSICCDLSGINIAACIDGSGIYISTTSGFSWINSNAPIASWTSICCNYTCTYLAACANNSGIYRSTNNGSTWNITTAPSANWVSICSNSTGQYLAACILNGTIYTSTNYGSSWINSGLPSFNWISISSSSNGSTLAACIQGGIIYISFNYGSTWLYLNTNTNWTAVTLSANGTYISATSLNGSVYNFTLSLYTLATPTISNLTTTSVTINYTTVITGKSYAVYLYTTNTFTPITPGVIFQTTNATTNGSFTFNITSGIRYYAAVIGYTQKNQKGIAFQSSYTGSIIYLQTPVAPTIGIITSINVIINYTSIVGANSYFAYIYTTNTFTPTTSGVISASVNSNVSGSITVSGLTPLTSYYAIIVAYSDVNGSGASSLQSSYSGFTTLPITSQITWFSIFSNTNNYWVPIAGRFITNTGIFYPANYEFWFATLNIPLLTGSQVVGNTERGICVSTNGSVIVRAKSTNSGYLQCSTNSGVSYTQGNFQNSWQQIYCSANGQYVIGVGDPYGGQTMYGILYSSDYGVTMNQSNFQTPKDSAYQAAVGLSMSSSGQYCVAIGNWIVNYTGYIYYSTNYGQTWTVSTSLTSVTSVCIEDNGIGYATRTSDAYLYKTTNYGQTWSQVTNSIINASITLGCALLSSPGTIFVIGSNNRVYISSTGGTSWVDKGSPGITNFSIVISVDGTYLAAYAYGSPIYVLI